MKIALLTALTLVVTHAQTTPPTFDLQVFLYYLGQMFDMVDTNNDNVMERQEQLAYADFVDRNGDHCINYTEYTFGLEIPPEQEVFQRVTFYFYDSLSETKRADGCISRQEFSELFTLFDLDGNNVITLSEFDVGGISVSQSIYELAISMGDFTTPRT